MKITVVSTAFAPPADARKKCLASVAAQFRPPFGTEVEHIYIDAAEQPSPKSHFANLTDVISKLPPERVVACVDGDDWLGPPSALISVARHHAAGAWVTYGSFQFADGRRGFARPYDAHENPRTAPWKATHLKTFRAGLFQRIRPDDLKIDGAFIPHARDQALMFPLLEMAGPARTAFVHEVIYVYNFANSTEFRGDEKTRADERKCVAHVRALPPYSRLEAL